MALVYSGVTKLKVNAIVGNASCVLMFQHYGRLPKHTSRHQGLRVVEQTNIWSGVAITTFDHGVYPNWPTGNHAAFFVRFGSRYVHGIANTIRIMAQYAGLSAIQLREISRKGHYESQWGRRWVGPSNNADAFYIIE